MQRIGVQGLRGDTDASGILAVFGFSGYTMSPR